MKSYALFQQYIWLVNTIHRYRKLTLEEINRHWIETEMSEGLPIARSTFNRHRDAILDMFGVIIECDRKDGFRYYIYNAEVLEEDTIQNWMLSTLSVNSMLSESRGVHERILLERIPSEGENLHKFIEAMKRNCGVYFGAIGGCGALLGKCIKKAEVIAYEDLGAEAIRRLEVENFPVVVIIDSEGNNLYETGRAGYLESLK